jgi:hypothetical protein
MGFIKRMVRIVDGSTYFIDDIKIRGCQVDLCGARLFQKTLFSTPVRKDSLSLNPKCNSVM